MKIDEYLYVCLVFSIVFFMHSLISAKVRQLSPIPVASKFTPGIPMLRVEMQRGRCTAP